LLVYEKKVTDGIICAQRSSYKDVLGGSFWKMCDAKRGMVLLNIVEAQEM